MTTDKSDNRKLVLSERTNSRDKLDPVLKCMTYNSRLFSEWFREVSETTTYINSIHIRYVLSVDVRCMFSYTWTFPTHYADTRNIEILVSVVFVLWNDARFLVSLTCRWRTPKTPNIQEELKHSLVYNKLLLEHSLTIYRYEHVVCVKNFKSYCCRKSDSDKTYLKVVHVRNHNNDRISL